MVKVHAGCMPAECQRIRDFTTFTTGCYLYDHDDMSIEPPEIDPQLNLCALAEAAGRYPQFAGRALRVVARPLVRGFAWQVEWDGPPPSGQDAWEFQNTAIRAYKRLAGIP